MAQPVTLLPGSVRLDFGEGREILVGDVPGREDWGPVTLHSGDGRVCGLWELCEKWQVHGRAWGAAETCRRVSPVLAVALVIRRDRKGLAPFPGVNLGLNVCSGGLPAVHSLQTVSRGSLGSRALQPS